MRKISIALLLPLLVAVIAIAVASHTPAGKRVYSYHESASDRTNEPSCFFLVGDFQGGLHIGPCGIGEAVNWSYHIYLSGSGDRFTFDRVEVEDGTLSGRQRLVAGEVFLDRTRNLVTISLKVGRGRNAEDFIGNGTFKFKKEP